jgi:hypothetical protein
MGTSQNRIDPELLKSATDQEHIRRMELHGNGYHYDDSVRDGYGETVRVFGKIIGDWGIDLHVANQRAKQQIWGSRKESPDIVYVADLDKDTPDLNRIVDVFKFSEVISARVDTQKPGACVTRHLDDFTGEIYDGAGDKIIRIFVMLEDWQPGQSMSFGNTVLTYWQKGHVTYSDYEKIPHSTGNASWNPRSILVITGVVSEETIRMLAFNLGEVYI